MKVLYVPLDERPCNYVYPQNLADMTEDIQLLKPPFEYMGKIKKPGDIEEMWGWLFRNVKECNYAIISIDALFYGNIINSRIHNKTLDDCDRYLNNLRKLKELNPNIEIHGYNLVARAAAYNNDAEDPSYWKNYGYNIWKCGYLRDRIQSDKASEEEKSELDSLINEIPKEYMEDFLNRRRINSYVNKKCLELVKESVIDYLVIPKDDCSEFGYAALEQQELSRIISKHKISDKVMVYPGADEVGCVLLARVFNKIKNYTPRIYVKYSSTYGPTIVPRYEDRPLNESIKSQISSIGGIMVTSASESDLLLAVHSPGRYMIEAIDQDSKDRSFTNYTNIAEIINYILFYRRTYGKPYAIADVAFSNGSDREFMALARKCGVFENVCAYGGWNTAQNTIGVTLAHGCLCSYYSMFANNEEKMRISIEFLLKKIVSDWFLQSEVTPELLSRKADFPNIDYYHLCENKKYMENVIKDMLQKLIDNELEGKFFGRQIELADIRLPWDRIFEADFKFKLI